MEAQTEAIRFYCGISERVWNHHPTAPQGHLLPISEAQGHREPKREKENCND